MPPNGTFLTLYYATVSLRIHAEFLNDESEKGNTGDATAYTVDYICPFIDNYFFK